METDALSLGNLAGKVTTIVRRNFSFVATVKLETRFSAAFKKEHGVSFLAGRMVDIVEDMFSSDFLSDKSPQTYKHYILVANVFHEHSNILDII